MGGKMARGIGQTPRYQLRSWQRCIVTLVSMGVLAAPVGAASAHDPVGLLKILEENDQVDNEITQTLSTLPPADTGTRAVLVNLQLWPMPRALTICFVSGSTATRQRVVKSMQKNWNVGQLSGNRLTYDAASFKNTPDCKTSSPADISVDFKPSDGHWSYLGILSTKHMPSMNLAGFNENNPTDAEFDRIVGHETGHALGLHHEHQSQSAPDCGWNFEYIWTHYLWKSHEQMRANFDKLQDYVENGKHAYTFLSYDQGSLMHYDFPDGAYAAGTGSPCFIKRNFKPSGQDKDALRMAYGANQSGSSRDLLSGALQTLSGPRAPSVQELLKLKLSLSN
jgi:hypothetical protein